LLGGRHAREVIVKKCTMLILILMSMHVIGCKTNEYWSFRCCRAIFEKGEDGTGFFWQMKSGGGHPGGAGGIVLLVCLVCFSIDLLMLPMTIPHDIWFSYNRERLERDYFVENEFGELIRESSKE
jgi:hypothetical protein